MYILVCEISNAPHLVHSTNNSPSSASGSLFGSANPEIGGAGTSSSVITGPNKLEGEPIDPSE
ncbi:MAG: Uncharacterised protein [Methanobacteriota archaeon]|nr:MAG: Uncharacterised protein [Euryarchaeota archaeon]